MTEQYDADLKEMLRLGVAALDNDELMDRIMPPDPGVTEIIDNMTDEECLSAGVFFRKLDAREMDARKF